MTHEERLARFGHHPDPVIDFCVEVEAFEGILFDIEHEIQTITPELLSRMDKAMAFHPFLNPGAINAKGILRELDRKLTSLIPALVFTYRNHRGKIAERRVRPISVRYGSTEWHPEPQWLLRAFDLDKQAEREFAMSGFATAVSSAVAIVEGLTARWRAHAGDNWTHYNDGFASGIEHTLKQLRAAETKEPGR